jgi:hypothetical protein
MSVISLCHLRHEVLRRSYVVLFETSLALAEGGPPLAPIYPTSGLYGGSATVRHFDEKSATENENRQLAVMLARSNMRQNLTILSECRYERQLACSDAPEASIKMLRVMKLGMEHASCGTDRNSCGGGNWCLLFS